MDVPNTLKYTKTHEWVKQVNDVAVIGITDHAQHELTDIVHIDDYPKIGTDVKKGTILAVVESVKAVADVYAPLSGTLLEINAGLEDTPELLNKKPYDAWIAKIKPSNKKELAELLPAEAYKKMLPN